MFIIYTYVEPYKILYLKQKEKKSNSVKKAVLDSYKNIDILNNDYIITLDIAFTDDKRKAEVFLTRDVAMKVVNILSGVIPEDFKIERVDDNGLL